MTTDNSDGGTPERNDRSNEESRFPTVTTTDEFHEALKELVTDAGSNGVDIRGSWPVAGSDGEASWDIEITRIIERSVLDLEETDDPVLAIVEAIAMREGIAMTDLPPLYDVIDPYMLNIVADANEDTQRQIRFQYYGYWITVHADGSILIDD